MSIRTIYYTNTNPGHSKDYEIMVDDSTMIITTRWGKIGGPKTESSTVYSNNRYLMESLAKAMSKRAARGYTLVSDSNLGATGMIATHIAPSVVSARHAPEVSKSTLLADIREMERAERM